MSAAAAASAGLRGARRAPRWFAALLLGLLAVLALPADQVSAHAVLVDTSPTADERLAAPPEEVELVFNEPVGLDAAGVRVFDSTGARRDTGAALLEGVRVRQPVGPLEDGWYVASYAIVSDDGHPVAGAFMFAVGDPSAVSVDPDAAALRLVDDLSTEDGWPWPRAAGNVLLLAGIGALFAATFLAPGLPGARRVAAAALVAAAAGHGSAAADTLVLSGRAGLSLGLRVVAPVVAAALVLTGWRPRLAFSVSVVSLAGFGLTGHGFTHGSPWLNWLLLTSHLLLGALWLGAAPFMAWISWRHGDDRALPAQRRFSTVATVALPVVVAAGGVLAWIYTGGDLSGPYGRALLAKSALVGSCALVGLFGRRSIARSPGVLRRVFAFETLAVVVIAGISAQLPATGPAGHADHTHHTQAASGVGDVVAAAPSCTIDLSGKIVDVSFDTATPGDNTVHLTALGGVFGELEVRARHELLGEQGLTWDIPLLAATHASGPVRVPLSGAWEVTVRDQADRFSVASGSCEVTFNDGEVR